MEKPWGPWGPWGQNDPSLHRFEKLPAFSPFRQKTTSVAVSGQLLLRYSPAARCTWGYLGDEPRWQQPWPWPSCKQHVDSKIAVWLESKYVLRHALRTLQRKKCLLSTIGVVIQKSGKSKRESSLLIIRSITWDRSFETTTHIRTFHLVFTFLAVFQYMSTKNMSYVFN